VKPKDDGKKSRSEPRQSVLQRRELPMAVSDFHTHLTVTPTWHPLGAALLPAGTQGHPISPVEGLGPTHSIPSLQGSEKNTV